MLDQLGIEAVRIDLPFRLNHVNCFMAEDETGWTIIDAGLNNDYTRKLWEQTIGKRNVTNLLITHYHPDHFGYAGGLQERTGAKVSMTKTDADLGLSSWQSRFLETMPEHYSISGVPDEMSEQLAGNTAGFQELVNPLPKIGHYFEEGEKVRIGLFEYEVIFVPGHSDGMVCFYNKDKNVLLSADHILPKITPNISYWYHGNKNPLASYLASLDKMKKLDAEFVIPSHGKPFYGANSRIEELKRHHSERLEETFDAIQAASTVYETCERLFKRPLTVHEMRFAVGETLAHLEFLRHAGECEREIENKVWRYRSC
ncbi:MBL fold metallo-hydrolase [Planococcus shenhongbingii]|uniref:MBL fold metallo-hydrolase n=1 Tax=Planococcus shenhongbingii TaxID=3058398 RepID=UPI0026158714|nr:MBL fold metallo-hydrolase [Planococcus sp. N016]WKA58916.1 MBL fold metallo-hydrolase [Planococcus sp. N016]